MKSGEDGGGNPEARATPGANDAAQAAREIKYSKGLTTVRLSGLCRLQRP
jgi:hypothetical protein